ncbi:MAG: hypothetical protein ACR2LI_16605 [Propionibacteriaceae bacterium]
MTSTQRPPLLIALQSEATVLMSLAIGQAGLAAGFLDGRKGLKEVHGLTAYLIAAVTIALLITAVVHRRRGGVSWPVFGAAILLVVEAAQITMGSVEIKGPHIFLGVIFTVLATLLTSYLFRPGFTPATGR